MKYLIACLGNIGAEYSNTRHNAGFVVADAMAASHNSTFEPNHLGSVCELHIKGKTLILLKPSTYMNASGKAVNYWMQNQKIGIENLLVVVDDIAIPFGSIRLRGSGSDGGHNGLKDITAAIHTEQFARLRIGIDKHFENGKQIDYVLGEWTDTEKQLLPAIQSLANDAVKSFVLEGLAVAMNKFNKNKFNKSVAGGK